MNSNFSGWLFHTATIVLVVLKLTGTVDWSWWWVLSPSLVSIGLAIVVFAVFGALIAVAATKSGKKW